MPTHVRFYIYETHYGKGIQHDRGLLYTK